MFVNGNVFQKKQNKQAYHKVFFCFILLLLYIVFNTKHKEYLCRITPNEYNLLSNILSLYPLGCIIYL